MNFGTMAMSWPDRRRQRQEIAVGLKLGTAGELGHACSLEPSAPPPFRARHGRPLTEPVLQAAPIGQHFAIDSFLFTETEARGPTETPFELDVIEG
jgi:hypothetical protein